MSHSGRRGRLETEPAACGDPEHETALRFTDESCLNVVDTSLERAPDRVISAEYQPVHAAGVERATERGRVVEQVS